MDDQIPNHTPQTKPPEPYSSRRERRAARRAERGESGNAVVIIVSLILIGLGVLLLFQTTGAISIPFNNWWGLFFLIPAIVLLERAWSMYRHSGNRWNRRSGTALLAGLVFILITIAFLFNFNWTIFGPVLIILVGVGILLNTWLSGRD